MPHGINSGDTHRRCSHISSVSLCETLKDITLRGDEQSFARQASRIGVTLADGFRFEELDSDTVSGLKRAVLDAQSIIEAQCGNAVTH
jgi:hypothetical protein